MDRSAEGEEGRLQKSSAQQEFLFGVWRLWGTTVQMTPRMKAVKIPATRAASERGRRAKDLLPFPSPCGSLLTRSY